ncbi:MAG TPA: hypothetical protein VHS31_05055 [Tepidisphaeraceae bacterium]|jgi:hypothetical protein|nr:hypothetical protein [Tepidisphaeraceae bacterium]
MIDEHIDRSVFKFTTFDEADADDVEFWMSKTPTEGIEYLRRWLYGDDQVDARLQRVFEFAELGKD